MIGYTSLLYSLRGPIQTPGLPARNMTLSWKSHILRITYIIEIQLRKIFSKSSHNVKNVFFSLTYWEIFNIKQGQGKKIKNK